MDEMRSAVRIMESNVFFIFFFYENQREMSGKHGTGIAGSCEIQYVLPSEKMSDDDCLSR